MKDYKAKRTYANGEKHVVYYIHTDCGAAYSLGWDTEEIAQIVREDSHLSISVGFLHLAHFRNLAYHTSDGLLLAEV